MCNVDALILGVCMLSVNVSKHYTMLCLSLLNVILSLMSLRGEIVQVGVKAGPV